MVADGSADAPHADLLLFVVHGVAAPANTIQLNT